MRRASVLVLCLGWLTVLVVAASPSLAAPLETVDTFEDTFDGSCTDGDCSLRDAVASVDAGGTVRVPPGFYPLSIAGTGSEAGDLDLERPVTIVGIGETGSFLDASALGDRVFDASATVTLRHLTLLGGSPVGTGGVVRVAGPVTLRIVLTTVFGGRARDGGGVAVGAGAAATIDRSWIADGRATDRGGALFVRGPTQLLRSTLSGNRAEGGGGAFVAPTASFRVDTATISGNVATRGGGVRALGGLELVSSTFAGNRAQVGGGVHAAPVDSFTRSSVFARNGAAGPGPVCFGSLSSAGHNVSDRRGCWSPRPGDRVVADPGVRLLRQNGGPTPTNALRTDSPAIGGGLDCLRRDQRGAPRHDCDSGAYELVFCLGRPVTIVGTPGDDEFSAGLGRDVFLGLAGNDEFQGSLNPDRACGGTGNDRLIAGPGNDRFLGNAGADRLFGEEGEDLLLGGPGSDICRGGPGRDRARGCESVPS